MEARRGGVEQAGERFGGLVYKKMSDTKVVVGIDLGSWTFKISAYADGKFTLLTNEANFRETPTLISFLQSQRLVGEQAINKLKSNYLNTVRAPHRLIGLEKNFELVEEELKYSTVHYEVGEEIHFSIHMAKDKNVRLQPEHLLISLISKICGIVANHKLDPQGYYIVVPSYLSHYERKLIKKCGEIVVRQNKVFLVDDWVSLAAQYTYSHSSDVRNGLRTVIFVDIGYSKCSFFVVEFTSSEPRLLDCEHMRYMGSKNIDHLLAQFYNQKLIKSKDSSKSVFGMPRAKVKLLDQVEKQRKVLSANEESYIMIESLFDDFDLSYNMSRKEFESVAAPVLNEIKKGIRKIRERMPSNYRPHSLQLLGGASRIPHIRTIMKETFNMEPSRTLNSNESISRGAAVYGAMASKIISFEYYLPNYNLIDICVSWNKTSLNGFFGESEDQYKSKMIIFKANSSAPSEYFLPIGNDGPIELYIYYGQPTSTKSIGYLRFNSPNRVKFILDSSKIVSVDLERGQFTACKMQGKKDSKWQDITKWEDDLRLIQSRIKIIYDIKNDYQSKFYELRSNIGSQKEVMTPEQYSSFTDQFKVMEQWIQAQNNRSLSTAADLELYQQQLEKIKSYENALGVLKQRKEAGKTLISQYEELKKKMEKVPLVTLKEWQKRKLGLLAQWLEDSFNKMVSRNWEGYYLTETSLTFAGEEFKRIMSMNM